MSAISTALDSLANGGKRVRVHDTQMVLKLPKTVKSLITEVAAKEDISDSALVRIALQEYFTRRGYNR